MDLIAVRAGCTFTGASIYISMAAKVGLVSSYVFDHFDQCKSRCLAAQCTFTGTNIYMGGFLWLLVLSDWENLIQILCI